MQGSSQKSALILVNQGSKMYEAWQLICKVVDFESGGAGSNPTEGHKSFFINFFAQWVKGIQIKIFLAILCYFDVQTTKQIAKIPQNEVKNLNFMSFASSS